MSARIRVAAWMVALWLPLVAACDRSQRRAEDTLRAVGATTLRQDAATFYKNLFVASTERYFVPRPSQWPESFRQFQPLRVRAYPDGFALAIRERRGLEEGFYIVPRGMDTTPRAGAGAQFRRVDDGVYWYAFSD